MMGATLPILVKSSLFRADGLGQRASLLYATNTAGAVCGTLLAGFYLVGGIGISASFLLAAGLNMLVGTAAVGASLFAASPMLASAKVEETPPSVSAAAQPGEIDLPERSRRLVLVVGALSGFASLALEVIWFRVLVLYFEATSYAFTAMLATVLFGIAAGSYVVTPLMRRRLDWFLWLGGLELAIGVASLFSLAVLSHVHHLVAFMKSAAPSLLADPVAPAFVVSFVALVPATLLMGLAFPIGLRLWASGAAVAANVGERIGVFYSLNVFGAILGSVAAGFLLLPWLGSQLSLVVVSAISLVSGLALLAAQPRRGLAFGWGTASICVFMLAAFATPGPFAGALDFRCPGERLLWREEGVQATVSVHQIRDGARRLYVDGLSQGDDRNLAVHRTLGHLPMVIHPEPKDVLVIGLGGGKTAGAVSQHARADVDVVELSVGVARGAEWFRHVNYDVLRQPNVHLRIDDGRNYLLLTPKRYDVVAADLIRPITAGANNIYSAEYFRLARESLKDDGLMMQWVGTDTETQRRLVIRTFLNVFPETTLWQVDLPSGGKSELLLGAKRPLQFDAASLAQKWEDLEANEAPASSGSRNPSLTLPLYRAGPRELAEQVGPGPILTDDRPLVEYFRSLARDR
jgi:spermidine synthase